MWPAMAIAAASLVTLSGRPAAQTKGGDIAVPFKVGEVLTYDVSWSTYLTAGDATMTVKQRLPGAAGSSAFDLVAEGKPTSLLDKLYHVYYKAETYLDARNLRPSIATVFSDERGRQKTRTTKFTGPTALEFQPKQNAPWEKHTTPPSALDPLAAMYVVRVLPLAAGKVYTMPVVDGSDLYNVKWQIAGPEPVTTPLGALQAWRITPTLTDGQGKAIPNKRVTLWMSNDARRLPLKLQVALPVGNFTLTLSRVTG
jgi:hypothetical protein